MSLFRKCRIGLPIFWYSGGRFNPPEITELREFPERDHCVVSHGEVIKETNDTTEAENAYLSACGQHHTSSGKLIPGKNKLVNAAITEEVL